MPNQGLITKIVSVTLLLSFVGLFPVLALAQQSATNPISLAISKVTRNGQVENTKKEGTNNFVYENELNLDDDIRYGWLGTDLNLKYKTSPAIGGGYLKIYLNDDTN